VLFGDIRLRENLERAGVDRAWCLFATTDDDLANIEACVQARRIAPGIRTVARVFDATLAERAEEAFGIDGVVSTTAVAATAFLSAALDERALRHLTLDGLRLAAVRLEVARPVGEEDLEGWARAGLRVIAHRSEGGDALSGSPPAGLARGDVVAVCGPEDVVRSTVLAAAAPVPTA
jgi:Trk K+ transport system NAD-binding subunit